MSTKKQIFKISTLKKLQADENSCVSLVPTTKLLALPPFFLTDMKSGILYLLNSMLKKYDRALGGIIIGYQNIKVLMDENTGIIPIGTSETEVNISVEFFIFQPKIGSFLEGVVNKKSTSHVGCLVHRYFNATILKPDDVDYEDWVCRDFNVDDKIIFKVKDLDFTSLLPHIEGIIDDERVSHEVGRNLNGNCDIGMDIVNNVNNKYLNEVSMSEEFSESDGQGKSMKDKKSTLKDNVSRDFEFDCVSDSKKKKKKKKKEKEEKDATDSSYHNETKEKGLVDKELTSDTMSKESNVDEKYFVKKKKKKKDKEKQKEYVRNTQPILTQVEKVSEDETCSVLEKVPNKREESFKPSKSKTESEEPFEQFNKTNQSCFANEAEDEIFYSTQLETSLPKKMNICFSPISKEENENLDEKKKKGKHKKRKREEEEEEEEKPIDSKKFKPSQSDTNDKSGLQIMMEKLCKEQLEKAKESSCKESSKEKKKKQNKSHQTNGGNVEKSERHSLVDELLKQEMKRVKEELELSGREKEKAKESKKKKEVNGERKHSVQDIMDRLLKDEMKRIKGSEKPEEKKEEKKKEESNKSLYEKLLKDARNSMNLDEKPKEWEKKKKEKEKKKKRNECSTSSASSLSSSQKTKNSHKKYKNGSDVTPTLEKFNLDKSLLSDSDQSSIRRKKGEESGEKKEKKRKSSSEGNESESLYEKLLREAKSLINRKEKKE